MSEPTSEESIPLRHKREVAFRQALQQYEVSTDLLGKLDTLVRHWQGDIDQARALLIADVDRLQEAMARSERHEGELGQENSTLREALRETRRRTSRLTLSDEDTDFFAQLGSLLEPCQEERDA